MTPQTTDQTSGNDTKDRIIEKAVVMFANNGFEGTSIRNLAKEADVNIAAINYHFENKENLYFSVLQQSHKKMSDEVLEIAQSKELAPDELVATIFDHFMANGPMLVAVFKIFLSVNSSVFKRLCDVEGFDGPPGALAMVNVFKARYPNISDQDLIYAVRSIFGQTIHFAVFASSFGSEIAQMDNKVRRFKPTPSEIREDLKRTTRILLERLDKSK